MSSGNLTADRRFDYARMLQETGDDAAAVDLFVQALALAPAWAEGRFALAEALARAGDTRAAEAAYRRYLELDPTDSMGAAVRLALLQSTTPPVLPNAYVRRLFDEYAPRFDQALTERLKYRAPEALHAAITKVSTARFTATLDLGCGTGLVGTAFRSATDWLEGVDLSPAMIAEAQRKAVYDRLAVADMIAHMKSATRRFDLVIAADVLVYVGDLAPVFAAVADVTSSGALFAFTVQRHEESGFRLGPEHRYSHSATYLNELISADFSSVQMTDDIFRQEKGVDVPGLLVVLKRA